MTKCHQCEKLAMYQFPAGQYTIPLCLDCYSKVFQIQQIQLENSERQVNFAADEIDSIVGFRTGPRFPERKTVHIGDVTLHNIKVSNSTVGSINTGTVGSLDIAITTLKQSDSKIAEALTKISQSVIDNQSVAKEIKDEVLEILSILAAEAASPKDRQKVTVTKTLLSRLGDLLEKAANLTTIWAQWGPVLRTAFGA